MRGKATFSMIGLVGSVLIKDNIAKVEIGSLDPSETNEEGSEWVTQAEWNIVTVDDDSIRDWISENLETGDLVTAEGRLRGDTITVGDEIVNNAALEAVSFERLAEVDQIDAPLVDLYLR